MRFLYPILALLAYVFFVASLVAGLVAVFLVPVAAGFLAAAMVAAGQFVALVRLLGALLRLTFGAVGRAGQLVADLFRALFSGDPEPTSTVGTYGREALPELFRLVDEVTRVAWIEFWWCMGQTPPSPTCELQGSCRGAGAE